MFHLDGGSYQSAMIDTYAVYTLVGCVTLRLCGLFQSVRGYLSVST